MHRRTLLTSVTASALAAAIGSSASAQQVDVRQQIISLTAATYVSIGFGNRAGAFQRGLADFSMLTRMDERWVGWGDSAECAHLLFSLANPADVRSYTLISQLVVDCWTGARNMTGSTGTSMRNICTAAAFLLRNPAAFSSMRTSRGETAALLLCFVAIAPGEERQEWARLGLEQTRLYGLNVLRAWSRDNMTGRWATVGIALAGDLDEALPLAERVLQQRTGIMEDIAEGRRPAPRSIGEAVVNGLSAAIEGVTGGSNIRGLGQTMAGLPILQAEVATIALLAGSEDRAVQLFEDSRSETMDPDAPRASAILLEDQLVRSGATVVQLATTSVGSIAVVSTLRGGRTQRFQTIFYPAGGNLMLEAMGGYNQGFSRRPGVLQKFDRASRANARRIQEEMTEYVDDATNVANALAGAALLSVLPGAGIQPGAELVIVLAPALAFLPIGLTRLPDGPTLAETYQVRYATSLKAAVDSMNAARTAQQPASVSLIAATGRNAPAHAAFESNAVLGSFDAAQRRAPAAGADPAALLNSLQGASYWHIASHGVWNFRRQEESGVMLAGRDPTTVADILAFHPNPAPRLVYMSACSTNMINVERDLNDFVGLNTAFQRGGAAGVLGTQWAVSDAASALLAAKFYDLHIGQRQTPAAALKGAQAWLKSATPAQLSDFIETQIAAGKIDAAASESMTGYLADLPASPPPFAHPYFWGGYQLYGA